jgi:hypothetical protein
MFQAKPRLSVIGSKPKRVIESSDEEDAVGSSSGAGPEAALYYALGAEGGKQINFPARSEATINVCIGCAAERVEPLRKCNCPCSWLFQLARVEVFAANGFLPPVMTDSGHNRWEMRWATLVLGTECALMPASGQMGVAHQQPRNAAAPGCGSR